VLACILQVWVFVLHVLHCVYCCVISACMASIMVRVDEGTKGLWVLAAHGELCSLSEWVRRACDARAGLAAGGNDGEVAVRTRPVSPSGDGPQTGGHPRQPPAASSFRPDFKKGK